MELEGFHPLWADWERTKEIRRRSREDARESLVRAWEATLALLLEERQSLVRSGRWVSGPADLLGVINRSRRETYHCRIIAWLLDPANRHGLGSSFLKSFLYECFPDDSPSSEELATCSTTCEVLRKKSRADIIVRTSHRTVVIEAKIDAVERDGQCNDLYDAFSTGPNTAFLFLTPTGRCPTTATTPGAKRSFQPMSFSEIRELLREAASSSLPQSSDAHGTVANYLLTLDHEYGPDMTDELDPRLVFYLEHRRHIDEWLELPKLERKATHRFFQSLADPLEEAMAELAGSPRPYFNTEGGYPKLFLSRQNWYADSNPSTPRVAVGLEWNRSRGFRNSYVGVWLNRDQDSSGALLEAVTASLQTVDGLARLKSTAWWPVSKYVRPEGPRFWENLEGFQELLLQEIIAMWNMSWECVDQAVGSVK